MRTAPALFLAFCALCIAPAARAAYFGKNKVQYKDFHWHVLETPHFEVLFYDGEGEVVQDAARMAERAYAQLSTLLKHDIKQRVPLILYASHSDFQQTNITDSMIDVGTGGVTELVRRRVFLPFTGSYGELEHVLTHELTHAFELDILLDPAASDPLSPFTFSPPLWVMEGLAEYLSRGSSDTHTDMWVRDAALSGSLPTVEQMANVNDIRVYRFGQSIWQFFASEYGGDRIGDLLRTMRDKRSLDRGLQAVAGVSLAEFSESWSVAMRRKELPCIAKHQATREFAKPVVTCRDMEARMILVPDISPQGDRVVYVSDQSLNRDLYLRQVEGKSPARKLVAGETSGGFESLRFFSAGTAWSPDGKTLAFAAKAGDQDALYLMDVETRRIVAKHRFGLDEVQTPTFSPDGQELVFVGLSGGTSDLYRVRRDGAHLQRLTNDRYAALDPQWSPDGRSIVYVTDEGPDTDLDALRFGRMHLDLLDLETGAKHDITPFPTGKAVSPAWSGDGEYVAFVSDRDGISNIYLLHLPTGQVFRLTDTLTGVSGILPTSPCLSWARSTHRLVFSAFDDESWDLYRIDEPLQVMRPLGLEPGAITVSAVADSGRATGRTEGANWTPADLARASCDLFDTDRPAPAAAAAAVPADGAVEIPAPRPAFRIRDYKVHLSPDLSNVGGALGYEAGFGGQSQMHFSDLLGNHNLSVGLGIYGSIKDSNLYLSYLNRTRRTNWALSGFAFRTRYGLVGNSHSANIENQTYRGLRVTALRPFDKFTRLEASLQAASVSGRFYLGQTAEEAATNPQVESMRSFVGPGLAYVQDTAVFGYTGPIKGHRLRLSLEGAVGQIDFVTFEADLRQYWNLDKWYTVAGRLYGGTSHGNTPQSLYLGGASSLRGYDYGALVGNNALLGSLEFRFPLVRRLALGWPLPLELGNVQGVLFGDAATAWDGEPFVTSRAVSGESKGRAPQLAYGLGARVGLGYIVLKLDWAQRYDTGTGLATPGSNVSLGFDF